MRTILALVFVLAFATSATAANFVGKDTYSGLNHLVGPVGLTYRIDDQTVRAFSDSNSFGEAFANNFYGKAGKAGVPTDAKGLNTDSKISISLWGRWHGTHGFETLTYNFEVYVYVATKLVTGKASDTGYVCVWSKTDSGFLADNEAVKKEMDSMLDFASDLAKDYKAAHTGAKASPEN